MKNITRNKNGFIKAGKIVSIFFYIIFVLILAALIFGFLIYRDQLVKLIPQEFIQKIVGGIKSREFPALSGPKTMVFEWKYDGRKFSIEETLYKSAYDYYQTEPKKYTCYGAICPTNWEAEYFKMFKEAKGDNIISEIAEKLKKIGERAGLSEDKVVELTIAFVQSIPYDEAKAKTAEPLPRYPYEVLYDNKGICSDKSFLAVSLLKQLGFGVALFNYDAAEHIAPAVKCVKEYSSYNSGYCYAEVTNTGFKIGEIPTIDANNNIAVIRTPISVGGGVTKPGGTELAAAKIFEVSDGKIYQAIIKTAQTIKEIADLEKQISDMVKAITPYKEQVNSFAEQANSYKSQAEAAYEDYKASRDIKDYNKYTSLYDQFDVAYNKYSAAVKQYNSQVEGYNKVVRQYNSLINTFYSE